MSFRITLTSLGATTTNLSITTNNITNRTPTSASVNWEPPNWISVGDTGPDQRTDDLSTVVQEIVGQPGWNSGNAMVIIFSGAGKRVAEAFDGEPASAPELVIEYSN